MVLLKGKKYSCETCIKGHRSSNCKHTDRPLFEIQKKGRPPTQCAHCRALRKTRQVHVKCICVPANPKDDKKGTDKMLETPAFPNGLKGPFIPSSQTSDETPSDSSQREPGCRCDDDDELCACCIPRKSAPRARKPKAIDTNPVHRDSPESDGSASSVAAQEAAGRPLVARSTTSEDMHHVGYHGHDHGFTPYGRAYESAHPRQNIADIAPEQGHLPSSSLSLFPPAPPIQSAPVFPGPFCACGHTCDCIGCGQAQQTGAEPPHCGSCLQCALLMGDSTGGDNVFAPPSSEYSLDIDDWIQQMAVPGYVNVNEDMIPNQTYDWSALDTSDIAPHGSCCGGGDHLTGSEEGLTVPELTRSRSPSDSGSSGAGWAGGREMSFYGLQPYFGFENGSSNFAEEMEPRVPYTSYV